MKKGLTELVFILDRSESGNSTGGIFIVHLLL